MQKAIEHLIGQLDFGKAGAQACKFSERFFTVFSSQSLVALLPLLGSIEAEPDLANFFALRPEGREIAQVIRALKLLPGYRAVNDEPMAPDVFQDSVVSGRRSTPIMLGLQAVD